MQELVKIEITLWDFRYYKIQQICFQEQYKAFLSNC